MLDQAEAFYPEYLHTYIAGGLDSLPFVKLSLQYSFAPLASINPFQLAAATKLPELDLHCEIFLEVALFSERCIVSPPTRFPPPGLRANAGTAAWLRYGETASLGEPSPTVTTKRGRRIDGVVDPA